MLLRVAAANLLKKLRFPASHAFPASTVTTTDALSGTQNHAYSFVLTLLTSLSLQFDDTPYIFSSKVSFGFACFSHVYSTLMVIVIMSLFF